MRVLMATARRAPYAALILMALSLAMLVIMQEWQTGALVVLSGFEFQVLTGSLMVTGLCYQWVLFFKKLLRDNRNARAILVSHRWVGVGMTYLFALHAVRMGHTWMTVLSAVFFLIAVTGVLNREVLRYRQNWIYLTWLACHIGLSAMLVPLLGVHIWVALAYQ
ncbi:hypothetical protein shim_09740 [Shimia sp. SK013]|uniref:hypothetical protein n=1 Tax=Shimia sp. SK013 TaxID=1389006 RepID=UPI0006CDA934|nr:hypothetical protein [Shimia sp. SK013]KPA22687.1 hypothetical protein shim_09740 [Shimia sp. SK013]